MVSQGQEQKQEDRAHAEHLKLVASLREFGIGGTGAETANQKVQRKRPIWGLAALAILLGLLAAGVFFAGQGDLERIAVRVHEPVYAPIEQVESGAAAGAVEAVGYVVAERTATVSSNVVGRVAEVLVQVGDRVQAGQVVARMDERAARIELERLQLSLEAERVKLKIKEADLALARRELERALYLEKRQVVNTAQVADRRSRVAVLEAERDAITLQIEMSEKRVGLQKQNLEDLIITAPFEGVVTHVAANPGEIVSPASGGGTFTRTGICTIIDLRSIKVMVEINERFLPRIGPGDSVRMTLPAFGDRVVSGTIARISPTADRQTGTIDILVSPESGANVELRPGFRVNALLGAERELANQDPVGAIIPEAAVLRDKKGAHVFLAENGRARLVRVSGAPDEAGSFRLSDPPRLDAPVIVWSSAKLGDGSPITIQ